jgi:hypothetical protein
MLATLTQNWHIMRLLRVVIGIFGIVEYLSVKEPMLLVVGGFLLVQGLFNIGCCGAGACEWSPNGDKN